MKNTFKISEFALMAVLLLLTGFSWSQGAAKLYSDAYQLEKEGRTFKAMKAFDEALEAAKKEQNIPIQMKCHLELAELQNNVVYYKEALKHYQAFTALYRQTLAEKTVQLSDSVQTLKSEVNTGKEKIKEKQNTIDYLSAEKLKAELTVRNLELYKERASMKLERENNRRNQLLFILGIGFLILLFLIIEYMRKRRSTLVLKVKNQEIKSEKDKSDGLLLNILPKSIATELKESGKTSSYHYKGVTVMFTDFKGFTTYAGLNNPEDVVAMLDFYFRGFDEIISKYPIEKIKTIGDAYLCVSGAPDENDDHAINIVNAALDFQDFVKANAHRKFGVGSELLEMRIGIHSGPLVAGVVGSKKFAYDVWGDTVNVAARMEQAGEEGQINVSETVVEACGDAFNFIYRGELEAKNKGKLKMYFVQAGKG